MMAKRSEESLNARMRWCMERAKGIEPSYAAWEAAVLPLNYARDERTLPGEAPSGKVPVALLRRLEGPNGGPQLVNRRPDICWAIDWKVVIRALPSCAI